MSRTISAHPKGGFELWSWAHHSVVDPGDWRWPNFSPREMACRATGKLAISPVFMDGLQAVRSDVALTMPVTSGYRSPEHNAAVSHTRALEGPHVDGQAADILAARYAAWKIVESAMRFGFNGLGIKQHGDERFLHLDRWHRRPNGTIWTYDEP